MAERARGYLGMTHNPFAQPSEGFFERGERRAHLDQLQHLSQWTRRVLLVTGPQGAGKSTLYRQLSAGLEPRAKAARINGHLVNTAREILASVAQGFGIAAASNANTQLLVNLIAEHIREQEAADRFCVTMIDDAESLEPQALEELLRLTGECPMRLVLFGDVVLTPAVERCARKLELNWHEIRLAGLNGQDARDYLEWRFAEAKYRGRLPFTDQQVSEVVRLAEGYPGRMNQLANVLLAKLESGDVRPDRTRFPAVHRALAVLVALLGGLSYLIWYQSREPLVLPSPTSTIAAPEIHPQLQIARHVDEPGIAPGAFAPALAAAESDSEPLAPAREPPAKRPPIVEPSTAQPPAVVPDDGMPAADVAAPADAGGDAAAQKAGQEAWHSAGWLLAQPAQAFTIQLVTVSTAERAAAFLDKQATPAEFATYRLMRDGRELHVIVFGIFTTREAAQTAAAQLPASVGRVQPWVRSLSEVQRAIAAP